MTTILPSTSGRSGLAPVLNVVGAVVVAFWLFRGSTTPGGLTPVVVIVSFAALVAWVARVLLPSGTSGRDLARDVLACVMLVCGALMVVPTDGLLITPAIVAVSAETAELPRPISFGAILALVGLAIVAAAALLDGRPASFVIGSAAGLALGLVVGISRRQQRVAEVRERELLARSLEIEAEQAHSALLADRATVARDIHDVLAHSLGGLVVQLDAVEALLENGRVDDAAARVGAARALAAEGLGEARRAVATLRDPAPEPAAGAASSQDTDPLAAAEAIDRLLDAHRSLGGDIVVSGGVGAGGAGGGTEAFALLDPPHRRALAAVLREGLSNARRHAPAETVTLEIDPATDGILRVRLANAVPIGGVAAGAGGGHGLIGMRERFDALGDASRLTAATVEGRFVVEATLPIVEPGASQKERLHEH